MTFNYLIGGLFMKKFMFITTLVLSYSCVIFSMNYYPYAVSLSAVTGRIHWTDQGLCYQPKDKNHFTPILGFATGKNGLYSILVPGRDERLRSCNVVVTFNNAHEQLSRSVHYDEVSLYVTPQGELVVSEGTNVQYTMQ